MYDNSRTVTDQYNILLVLQNRKLTGAGEFYASAFNRLVRQIPQIQRSAPAAEKAAADDLAQTLAVLIGEEKYTTSDGDLWSAYEAFTAPQVKAETLISLGKLRATKYLPMVVRALHDLNAAPPRGREEADSKGIVARGAIIALEKFRDESGYLPVFIMSVGSYPERIKELARAALPTILEDPSALLTEEVIKSSSYASSIKFVALQTIEDANVPSASKSTAAIASLSESWRASTNDVRQRGEVARMRKTSIDMIRRYGTSDPAVYPLLERSYKEGFDDDEKLLSIQTLGTLATEDSAKLLNSFLMILIGKIQSGSNTRSDGDMLRAIIPALGAIGNATSRAPLRMLLTLDAATNAIKTLANDALGKFPTQ
ncbi:MAG: hypothetical protein LBR99_00455 [Treponema sp.]|nr:hypothetical protein [Treponema sp.]